VDVEGWLTDDQADLLRQSAQVLRAGEQIVEIGSFRGRSTIVLASSAADGVAITAIDPHAGTDRGPQEISGKEVEAEDDSQRFVANLEAAGVRERVHYLREWSQAALADLDGPVELLYIDGAHRYGPARADLVRWGERVAPGGTLLIHDSFSSVGVTAAILTALTFSSHWRYVGRSGSMTEYRRSPLRGSERAGNAARQLGELPWFARNVLYKALIVAGLRSVAVRLGHDPAQEWPF
jgi:predicted O-methyltransferase YrrM